MIEFSSVHKKYGRKQAVNSLSFKLEKGKIYGLVGPNGSGKSTTLKLIAGLVYPTDGIIKVDGKKPDRKNGQHSCILNRIRHIISFIHSIGPD